jgi:hypothetical protein
MAARFGSDAAISLAVAEVALGFAFDAANIHVVNEAITQERTANRTLLLDVTNTREDLEHRRADNARLIDAVTKEERARAGN